MVPRIIILILLCWASVPTAFGQVVKTVQWPTRYASSPPSNVDARWLATFRLGLNGLGEAQAVSLSGTAAQLMGLSQEQAGRLQRLLVPRYEEIKQDPVFKDAKSALAYCFSETKPTNGIATVYVPAEPDINKPAIVFLHGYGGSFLWPIHTLAKAFPDRIIIAPAYGLSGGNIDPLYLQQALRATQEALEWDRPFPKPVLVGLSAGVRGVLRLYAPRAAQYTGAICLAGYPATEVLPAYRPGHRVEFICGEKELFVQNRMLARNVEKMTAQGARVTVQLMPLADHFFLAESLDDSVTRLKLAMSRLHE